MKFTCGTAAPAHLSEVNTLKNSRPCPSLRSKHLETVFFPGVYGSSESIGHADVCHALNANVELCGPETSALSPQCDKRNWRKVNAIYERNIEYSIVRIITDLPLCHEICEPLLSRVKQRKSLLFPCLIAEIGMSVNPEVAIYMFSSSLVSSGVFLV